MSTDVGSFEVLEFSPKMPLLGMHAGKGRKDTCLPKEDYTFFSLCEILCPVM